MDKVKIDVEYMTDYIHYIECLVLKDYYDAHMNILRRVREENRK